MIIHGKITFDDRKPLYDAENSLRTHRIEGENTTNGKEITLLENNNQTFYREIWETNHTGETLLVNDIRNTTIG